MRVRDLKGRAMFLFARMKGNLSRKAKTASPVRKRTPAPAGKFRQEFYRKAMALSRYHLTRAAFYKAALFFARNLLLSRFFCYYIYNVEAKTGNGRVQSQKSAKSC